MTLCDGWPTLTQSASWLFIHERRNDKHGHLVFFHVASLGCRSELQSSLWILLPCRNYTVAQQFTGAAGIWGLRLKPFIWRFEKCIGLVSLNTLGDNGFETNGEGKKGRHYVAESGGLQDKTLRGRLQELIDD